MDLVGGGGVSEVTANIYADMCDDAEDDTKDQASIIRLFLKILSFSKTVCYVTFSNYSATFKVICACK